MTYTPPPTFTAGNVLTGAQMTILGNDILALVDRIQVVRKAADQTVTNSTALVNDTGLAFTAVAGQSYALDMTLFHSNAGTHTADLKIAFTFPSGTLTFGAIGLDPAGTTEPLGSASTTGIPTATSGTSTISLGSGNDCVAIVRGLFVCTVSGTVQLQWAQNTANASGTIVRANSFLTATRVAV